MTIRGQKSLSIFQLFPKDPLDFCSSDLAVLLQNSVLNFNNFKMGRLQLPEFPSQYRESKAYLLLTVSHISLYILIKIAA